MTNQLHVGDNFRTNPLSLKPGGYDVTVFYSNGKSFIYDKIKTPAKYIKRIADDGKHGTIIEIHIDGEVAWKLGIMDAPNPWDLKI
jgi:hypothetical protein